MAEKHRPPAHLDKEARKEWKRLIPLLLGARVLTEADYMPLANLCQAWATLKEAQLLLNKSGLLLKSKDGIRRSPLVMIIRDQVETVNKLCREFGLTPSSRTRVHVGQEEKATNKWADVG